MRPRGDHADVLCGQLVAEAGKLWHREQPGEREGEEEKAWGGKKGELREGEETERQSEGEEFQLFANGVGKRERERNTGDRELESCTDSRGSEWRQERGREAHVSAAGFISPVADVISDVYSVLMTNGIIGDDGSNVKERGKALPEREEEGNEREEGEKADSDNLSSPMTLVNGTDCCDRETQSSCLEELVPKQEWKVAKKVVPPDVDSLRMRQLEGDVTWLQTELGALQRHLHLLELWGETAGGKGRGRASSAMERLETLDSLRQRLMWVRQELQEEVNCTQEFRELQRQRNDKLEAMLLRDDSPPLSPDSRDLMESLSPPYSPRESSIASPSPKKIWGSHGSSWPFSPSHSPSPRPLHRSMELDSSANPRFKPLKMHFKSKSAELVPPEKLQQNHQPVGGAIQKMASGVRGLISELSLAGMMTAAFEAAVRSYDHENNRNGNGNGNGHGNGNEDGSQKEVEVVPPTSEENQLAVSPPSPLSEPDSEGLPWLLRGAGIGAMKGRESDGGASIGSSFAALSEGGSDFSDGEGQHGQEGWKETVGAQQISRRQSLSGNLKRKSGKIGGKIASLFQASKSLTSGEEWGRTQSLGDIGRPTEGKPVGLRRMLSSDMSLGIEVVKGSRLNRRNSLDLSSPFLNSDFEDPDEKWPSREKGRRLTRRNSTSSIEQPPPTAVLDNVVATVRAREEEGTTRSQGMMEKQRKNSVSNLEILEQTLYMEEENGENEFLDEDLSPRGDSGWVDKFDEDPGLTTLSAVESDSAPEDAWEAQQKRRFTRRNSTNSVSISPIETPSSPEGDARPRRSSITLTRDVSLDKGWLEDQLRHTEGGLWKKFPSLEETRNSDTSKQPWRKGFSFDTRTPPKKPFLAMEFATSFTGRPNELVEEILRCMVTIYGRQSSRSSSMVGHRASRTTIGLNLESPIGNRRGTDLGLGRRTPGYRSLVGASGPLAPTPVESSFEDYMDKVSPFSNSPTSFELTESGKQHFFPSPTSSMSDLEERSSYTDLPIKENREESPSANHSEASTPRKAVHHGWGYPPRKPPPVPSNGEHEKLGGSLFSFGLRRYASASLNPDSFSDVLTSPKGVKMNSESIANDPYGILHDHPCPDSGDYVEMVNVTIPPTSEQRDRVDLTTLSRYSALMEQLSKTDPSRLTHEQRLAFWINLYNALVMNMYMEHGRPQTHSRQVSLISKASCRVGGTAVSVPEIEYAILRAQSHWGTQVANSGHAAIRLLSGRKAFSSRVMVAKFEKSDKRSSWALTKPEPLVTFALCSGAFSSPAVRLYTPENVRVELGRAKAMYLLAAVGISKNRKIRLPKILSWYSRDFVSDENRLAEWVAHQLPEPQASILAGRLPAGKRATHNSKSIEMVHFDWSFRYLLEPLPPQRSNS